MEMESNKTNVTSIRVINDRNCANRLDSETLLEVTIGTTKIWSYQTSWQRFKYHHERFRKLTFRGLALRQSEGLTKGEGLTIGSREEFWDNWEKKHSLLHRRKVSIATL